MVGRLLVGFGIGISAVVVPAYLGEVAPAGVRGRIVEARALCRTCAALLHPASHGVALAQHLLCAAGPQQQTPSPQSAGV